MNPEAFKIFNIPIYWYGVIITFAVIIGLFVTYINTKVSKGRVIFDDITDAFLYAFPLAIVGARLYYVIFEWENYNSFKDILDFRSGGLAIHGGLIGAAIGVLIYSKVKKKSLRQILDMADATVPGLILAQAIGRWGNFMNQEAHGDPVSLEFISKFPEFIQKGMNIEGVYYNPTFLYESIWNVIVFIILMYIFKRRQENREGLVLYSYMILYSVGRFFIEGLRTDSLMIFHLRQAQLISIAMILVGILLIYLTKKKNKSN